MTPNQVWGDEGVDLNGDEYITVVLNLIQDPCFPARFRLECMDPKSSLGRRVVFKNSEYKTIVVVNLIQDP